MGESYRVTNATFEVLRSLAIVLWSLSVPAVIVSWTTKLGVATLGRDPHTTLLLIVDHPWSCLVVLLLSTVMLHELLWDRKPMNWLQRQYQDAPLRTLHILTCSALVLLVDALSVLAAYGAACSGGRCSLVDVLTLLYRVQPLIELGVVLLYARCASPITDRLVGLGVLLPG
jgi:hypothetical protein